MNKPPIGIMPKFIHDEQRQYELKGAITRFMEENSEIPAEWITEYNDLTRSIKAETRGKNPQYCYPKGFIIVEHYRGD